MKFLTLNNVEYSINLGKYINNVVKSSDMKNKVKEVLRKKYPTVSILEEVPIKIQIGGGSKTSTLYLDIYIPMLDLAVEINGEQHYRFIPHFHGSIDKFMRQCDNDKKKKKWCELNGISLISIMDKDPEWQKQLQ